MDAKPELTAAEMIENTICNKASTEPGFAVAFALLMIRNELDNISDQLCCIDRSLSGLGKKEE
jgi:hypothetical protein